MAAKLLNIEAGDRITKVCVSVKRGKTFQILDSFMFQTPDGAVQDGQIVDAAAMAESLTAELARHNVTDAKNAVFTLTSAKVASREVMLPPVKDNRIKAVVETNASDYFPVDMSKYRVSYNLLERKTGETPGCRVLVMAAPRLLLESYARLAEAAGLQIEAIDFCGNSQYQVLRGLAGEGVTMYVDVNVTNTFVTFMADGILLLQRNFSVGGDELISTAMNAAGRGDSEYLKTMRDAGEDAFLGQYLDEAQRYESLNRLVSGVARTANFFKSDHAETPVTQVVLMGTCSRLAGLRDMIAHEIGLETVLLHDVSGIQFVANSAEGVSAYISCIGSLVAPLDLLPEELRAQRKKKRQEGDPIRTGALICAALSVLGVGLSAFAIICYYSAVSHQQQLENRIAELSYVENTYNTYLAYQSTDASLQVVGDYANDANSRLVLFMRELERKMPSSILLLSAVCDSEGVTMNVTVPGLEEAAVVISQLRGFESVAELNISAIAESAGDTGITTASFSVSCAYASAAEPEPTPAPEAAADPAAVQ